jgi:hypothetical protein
MLNKALMFCLFVVLSASIVFAVQWQMESVPFEFPGTSVKKASVVRKSLSLSSRQLSGKKQVLLEYSIPAGVKESFIDIYAINGVKAGSLRINPRSTRTVWNGSSVKGAGTYTAVLKAGIHKKTIRFVIAN